MNKQIITIMLGVVLMITLISSVSATSKIKISYEETEWDLDFFSGETIINELEFCNKYNEDKEIDLSYEIEGNEFNLTGITFTFSDDNFELDEDDCKDINFTITSQPNYKPDSFTITIRADDEDIDDDYDDYYWSWSGSGYCEYDKNYDWKCSEWSECSNGEQTRDCKDKNNCNNAYGKPDEVRDCEEIIILPDDTDDAIDDADDTEQSKAWIWILIGIFLVLVIIYFIWKIKTNKGEETIVDEEEDIDTNNIPLSSKEELVGEEDEK